MRLFLSKLLDKTKRGADSQSAASQIIGTFVVALACSALLRADGGSLVLQQQAGPFSISVFGSPEPLRIGLADISIMLQQKDNRSPVLDAKVMVRLSRSDTEGIARIAAAATHARATNKLLYAAQLHIPDQGKWQLSVDVDVPGKGVAQAAGDIEVQGPQAPIVAYWPYLAIPPVIIGLYVLNRYLRRRTMRHRSTESGRS